MFSACSQVEKTESAESKKEEKVEMNVQEQEQSKFTKAEIPAMETEPVKEEKTLPDKEVITEMLTAILDWSGLQYMYETSLIETLTANQAVPMVAHAAGYYEKTLNSNEECYRLIPKEELEKIMMDYFGKMFEISEVTDCASSMITIDENADVLLSVGDWGGQVPSFEITDISFADDQTGEVIVTAEYGSYDIDLNITEPYGYVVTYRMKENKDSKYGFVITDMESYQKQVESATSDWAQAYINYLQNECNTEMNVGYVLLYINDDDIPELAEIGNGEAAGCRINNFYNGEVFITQLRRMSFSYIEKENLNINLMEVVKTI